MERQERQATRRNTKRSRVVTFLLGAKRPLDSTTAADAEHWPERLGVLGVSITAGAQPLGALRPSLTLPN